MKLVDESRVQDKSAETPGPVINPLDYRTATLGSMRELQVD
jgi:hypothetical protein